MGNQSGEHLPDGTEKFSLVRGDRFFRIQRAIGLIPADGGLGVGRRAVFLALVTCCRSRCGRISPGELFPAA
jgi:hypothetical protein